MADYTNNAQQRILKILVFLGGHEVNGLAPSQISKELKVAPSHVTRDMQNLGTAGLAEQLPDSGRWRLSPRIPQIATAMLNGISRSQSKVDEVKQRYTTTPY